MPATETRHPNTARREVFVYSHCHCVLLFLSSFYLIFTRQQALLAAISEKDANIALLELSASNKKKSQEEVLSLKREKDRLMHQLKQQVSTAGLLHSAHNDVSLQGGF